MANSESDSSYSDFSIQSDVENVPINESDISVSPVSTPHTSDLSFPSSSSSDDELVSNLVWHSQYLAPVTISPFTQPSGHVHPLPSTAKEMDFFTQFFDPVMLELLVQETNRYAEMCIKERPDPRWQPTSVEEMRAYMGIMVVMSIMQIPSYTIAWGSKKMFSLPGISDVFTKNRFEKLTKYFHINDRTTNPARNEPGHDKLHLVRPILDAVNEKCLTNYNPPRDQSVDEAMIAFRGRLGFKQYLPAKPTKFGIKVWMRASSKSGYCHQFQVYTGRDVRGIPEAGLGSRVVLDLTQHLRGKNYHIYMDNYFSSPTLFQELYDYGLFACGTVRTNRRGLPPTLRYAGKLEKQGEMKSWQKGPMAVSLWKDKKSVAFLYTNCSPTDVTTVSRKQKDGSYKDVKCPQACSMYTQNMGGVDRADQLRAQYSTFRKAKKWWRYLFWFLFDVCLINSYICMKESVSHVLHTSKGRQRPRTQLEFRMSLAEQLIGNYRGQRKRKLPSTIDPLGQGHWPTWMDKRGRCRMCSESQKRHEVFVGCTACRIHLCIDNDCFARYHARLAQHFALHN